MKFNRPTSTITSPESCDRFCRCAGARSASPPYRLPYGQSETGFLVEASRCTRVPSREQSKKSQRLGNLASTRPHARCVCFRRLPCRRIGLPVCLTVLPRDERGRKNFISFLPFTMNAKKNKDVAAFGPHAEAKNGPVKQFRVDDVSASVFARERNGRTFYSVSFTRSYKDRDGTWRYTKNFDVEDLGRVVTSAQQAAEWIHAEVPPQ